MIGPLIFGLVMATLLWCLTNRATGMVVPPDPSFQRVTPTRASDRVAARIRDADPEFHEEAFLERAARAFLAVQEARGGDLAACRAFVSDGIFEGLGSATASLQQLGARQRLVDVALTQIQLAHLQTQEHFDELSVGVQATARIERRVGSAAPRSQAVSLAGFWTFLRRRGGKSRAAPGLVECHCPNCGAPIATLEHARCASCRSWLRSGEHDWVLCEITQPRHWAPRAAARIPGIEAIRVSDPAFSVQHLEDRVALAFWRARLAEEQQRPQLLASMCRPEGLRTSTSRRDRRIPVANVEIQQVETLGFRREAERERAAALVRWRARGSRARPRCDLFLLERQAGAQSQPEAVISSAHCPACGAPESGEQPACGFCGEVLNDGRQDWLLAEIASTRARRGRGLLAQLSRDPRGDARVLDVPDLPPAMLPWALHLISPEAPRPELASIEEARASLPRLVDLALARGGIEGHRREVLEAIAWNAGYTALDLRSLIDRRERGALAET